MCMPCVIHAFSCVIHAVGIAQYVKDEYHLSDGIISADTTADQVLMRFKPSGNRSLIHLIHIGQFFIATGAYGWFFRGWIRSFHK